MNLEAIIGWYIGTLIIESLTYGGAGFLFFKLLKGKDKYWLVGVFATFIVFVIWNGYISNSVFRALEVSINNKAFLDFLGENATNFFTTDFSDIVIAFIQVLIGFKIAQVIGRKLQKG